MGERVGKNKCFVISEIGEPGSLPRKRADRFLHIIERAFERVAVQTGRLIRAERLDGDRGVENFMRSVVIRIMRDEFIIAVLSNRNPNAHLELGIALAAGRRVMILLEHKEDMPSDLAGNKYIVCNLYDSDQTIQELATEIMERLDKPEPLVAFGGYNALGKPSHGVRYINKFKDLTFEEWSEFLWSAEKEITIATTALAYLYDPMRRWFYSRSHLSRRQQGAKSGDSGADRSLLEILLQRAAAEGVRVRLLILSPNHPFIDHIVHRTDADEHRKSIENVRSETRTTLQFLAKILAAPQSNEAELATFLKSSYPTLDFDTLKTGGSLQLVPVTRGPLYSRVTLSDKGAIVTPFHLVEATNSEGPAFWLENTTLLDHNDERVQNNFYYKVAQDLEELFAINRSSVVTLQDAYLRQLIGLKAPR